MCIDENRIEIRWPEKIKNRAVQLFEKGRSISYIFSFFSFAIPISTIASWKKNFDARGNIDNLKSIIKEEK
jgi:hypothetical protein